MRRTLGEGGMAEGPGKGGAESPMARWIRYSGSGCRWLSVYPKRLKDGYGETASTPSIFGMVGGQWGARCSQERESSRIRRILGVYTSEYQTSRLEAWETRRLRL